MILGDVIYQGHYFAAAAFAGVICGFVYDVLYAVRVFIRAGGTVQFFLDILFSVCCAAVVFFVFYPINGFYIRWYMVLGFAVGFYIQRRTYKKPVAIFCRAVYNKLACVFAKLRLKCHQICKTRKKILQLEGQTGDGKTTV